MTFQVYGRLCLSVAAVFLLSACSTIQPIALDAEALTSQSRADFVEAQAGVAPITAELTLDEALARALKYNLDRRVKMLEVALSLKQLDTSQYDMLPQLLAQSGYSWRSNDNYSKSENLQTGVVTDPQVVSQAREHDTASLGLTWNMLDFGVSYYAAKQQADRMLIATERRRKAMQLLMQDVRTAFWRAYSAQRLRGVVRETVRKAEAALATSRTAEAEKLRNPLDSLRYQRQVLESLRLLEAIDQELSTAQIKLASLINAPLDQKLVLAAPDQTTNRKILSIPVEAMEEAAMLANADLREQHYNARIAREETHKTMLRLFPNLVFTSGANADSDVYLVNASWLNVGAQLSFNLFNLLSGPTRVQLAEAGVALADQQRVATQMAVLTQVHLARQQYANALQQYNRADQIWQTDRRITEQLDNRDEAKTQSELDLVANRTTTILSQLRRFQALAFVQEAEAKLQATLGIDPVIGSVDTLSRTELSREIASGGDAWIEIATRGALPAPPEPQK